MNKEMSIDFFNAVSIMRDGSIVKSDKIYYKIDKDRRLYKRSETTEWSASQNEFNDMVYLQFTLVQPEQKFKEVVMYAPAYEDYYLTTKLFISKKEAIDFDKTVKGYVPVTVFIKE